MKKLFLILLGFVAFTVNAQILVNDTSTTTNNAVNVQDTFFSVYLELIPYQDMSTSDTTIYVKVKSYCCKDTYDDGITNTYIYNELIYDYNFTYLPSSNDSTVMKLSVRKLQDLLISANGWHRDSLEIIE